MRPLGQFSLPGLQPERSAQVSPNASSSLKGAPRRCASSNIRELAVKTFSSSGGHSFLRQGRQIVILASPVCSVTNFAASPTSVSAHRSQRPAIVSSPTRRARLETSYERVLGSDVFNNLLG